MAKKKDDWLSPKEKALEVMRQQTRWRKCQLIASVIYKSELPDGRLDSLRERISYEIREAQEADERRIS